MSKFVGTTFSNEAKAYEGTLALKKLHAEGELTLYGLAVIIKDASGKLSVKEGPDDLPGTAVGSLVGALLGVLGGPAGVLVGMTAGMMLGALGTFSTSAWARISWTRSLASWPQARRRW